MNFVEPMHLLVLQALKLNFLLSIDTESGVFLFEKWMLVLNSAHETKALIGDTCITFPPLSVTLFRDGVPVLCGNREWSVGNEAIIDLVMPVLVEKSDELQLKNPDNLITRWVNDDLSPHDDAFVEALFDSLEDDFNELDDVDVREGTVLQMIDLAEAEAAGQARLFA